MSRPRPRRYGNKPQHAEAHRDCSGPHSDCAAAGAARVRANRGRCSGSRGADHDPRISKAHRILQCSTATPCHVHFCRIIFSAVGGERLRRKPAAFRIEVCSGDGIRLRYFSIYFSDDCDVANADERSLSGGCSIGFRIRLYCSPHGNAGATAATVGGCLLDSLSSCLWCGQAISSLTSSVVRWVGT